MSNEMGQYERPRWWQRVFKVEVIVVLLIIGMAAYLLHPNLPMFRGKVSDKDVQEATLSMLSQPTFSGGNFEEQVLGEVVTFDLYDLRQDPPMIYFSIRKNRRETGELQQAADRFLADSSNVETEQMQSEGHWAFSTPASNFRVAPDMKLTFPYNPIEYDVSLKELTLNMRNVGMYGGKLQAVLSRRGRSVTVMISHGVFVAEPGNPSVHRLVVNLLKDVQTDPTTKHQLIIQTLLDFVTREISYNGLASLSSSETMKRAPETLMTGTGDCSNKAILFASLLEQTDRDYILVYFRDHISVAVEVGNFPTDNGWIFEWGGKEWVICETTTPGFQIGSTILVENFSLESIRYIQRPREKNTIYDARTGEKLLFTADLP